MMRETVNMKRLAATGKKKTALIKDKREKKIQRTETGMKIITESSVNTRKNHDTVRRDISNRAK